MTPTEGSARDRSPCSSCLNRLPKCYWRLTPYPEKWEEAACGLSVNDSNSLRSRSPNCFYSVGSDVEQRHSAVLGCSAHPKDAVVCHSLCCPQAYLTAPVTILSCSWGSGTLFQVSEAAEMEREEERHYNATRQEVMWEASWLAVVYCGKF